jgi:hypothetical protein
MIMTGMIVVMAGVAMVMVGMIPTVSKGNQD